MQSFFLALHFFFVPIILAAGFVTLVTGLSLLATNLGYIATPQRVGWFFQRMLWITGGLGALQAVWGAFLYLGGARPTDMNNLHFVYGGIVLLAIPVAWVYSDQKDVRRDLIIMSIAVAAVIGAAVRALMTGGAIPH